MIGMWHVDERTGALMYLPREQYLALPTAEADKCGVTPTMAIRLWERRKREAAGKN